MEGKMDQVNDTNNNACNNAIDVTENALNFIRKSVEDEKCLGIRVNVVSGGCCGLSYSIDFVNDVDPSDLLVHKDGVNIYIAAQAVMFIAGTTMDYISSPMGGNIVFHNPNIRTACGCGKSFSVDDEENSSSGCCDRSCCC